MNILIAFVILWAIFVIHGTEQPSHRIDRVEKGQPATGVLQPGDRVISVDGRTGSLATLSRQIATHHCAGTPTAGCLATTPARIVVDRDGVRRRFVLRPRYDAALKKTRVGFSFGSVAHPEGPADAATLSGKAMWRVSKGTVSAVARIFDPQQRKQISGVVGTYDVTRQAISFDSTQAFLVLAIISLSLAIVNLFPFLPLDGGHIFWALAPGEADPLLDHGARGRAGVRAGDHAVRDRADQRHRSPPRHGVQRAVAFGPRHRGTRQEG
jgi:regulator of sigma E protease